MFLNTLNSLNQKCKYIFRHKTQNPKGTENVFKYHKKKSENILGTQNIIVSGCDTENQK